MAAFCYALLISLCVASTQVWAQQKPQATATSAADQTPQYKGGADQMMADLQRNAHYPAAALRAQVSGRVIVSFVVEADGSVGETHIVSSPSPLLNDAVLQAVKSLGAFTPAQANGKPVRGTLTCPVTFRMTSTTTSRAAALVLSSGPPVQPQALASAENTVVSKLVGFRDSTYNPDKKTTVIYQHYFTYDRQGRPETHRLDYLNNGQPASSQQLRYHYRPDGLLASKTSDHTKYVYEYTSTGQLSAILLSILMKDRWRLVEETRLTEKEVGKKSNRVVSLTMRKVPNNPIQDSTRQQYCAIDYTISAQNSIIKSAVLSYGYRNFERPTSYTFTQDTNPNPFEDLFVERWYQFELERSGPHNLVTETQNGRLFKAFAYTYDAAGLPLQCIISNGARQAYRVQHFAYADIVVPRARPLTALAADSVSGLRIYPNPATATTLIKAASVGPGQATLRLYNASGQLVRQSVHMVTTDFNVNLSVAGLEKGVYVVEVAGPTAVVKGKLLVE
ncbi:TonB family protein [Hymenobacter volaticus]|uniref:TonB family protein n=1 Tax=Hymenobacter volaticus TaxID=2932254 RepID=A0ABY4G823_9BACT|nr:TonB family protein [Hymenobacter volaticus]UOQ66992.1 TonB family protein [Hymenobacter volaticus]